MSLITTPGATDANSYVDRAASVEYFTLRNVQAWLDAGEAKQSAALVRATDYIDAHYVFAGVPATATQALANPRTDEDDIAPAVRKATLELALLALTNDLFAPSKPQLLSDEKSVGSVSVKKQFSETKSGDPYPAITTILKAIGARRRGAAVAMSKLFS